MTPSLLPAVILKEQLRCKQVFLGNPPPVRMSDIFILVPYHVLPGLHPKWCLIMFPPKASSKFYLPSCLVHSYLF